MRSSGKERLREIQLQKELEAKARLTDLLKANQPVPVPEPMQEESPRARMKREKIEASRAAIAAMGVSTDVRDR